MRVEVEGIEHGSLLGSGLRNLRAAVALHFAHYNFVRTHQTLRVTPAMEAGIADHKWSLGDLLDASVDACAKKMAA